MKPNVAVCRLESQPPTHCAGGLHSLEWVIEGSIAICAGGHDQVVWVIGENNRLRCEVNSAARALAVHALDLGKNVRMEPQIVYVEVPAPPQIVYVEVPAPPQIVYVEVSAPPQIVYVEVPAPPQMVKKRQHASTLANPVTREELMGLTAKYRQREVAKRIGISRGLLSDIVSGRRNLTMAVALRAGQAVRDWASINATH